MAELVFESLGVLFVSWWSGATWSAVNFKPKPWAHKALLGSGCWEKTQKRFARHLTVTYDTCSNSAQMLQHLRCWQLFEGPFLSKRVRGTTNDPKTSYFCAERWGCAASIDTVVQTDQTEMNNSAILTVQYVSKFWLKRSGTGIQKEHAITHAVSCRSIQSNIDYVFKP